MIKRSFIDYSGKLGYLIGSVKDVPSILQYSLSTATSAALASVEFMMYESLAKEIDLPYLDIDLSYLFSDVTLGALVVARTARSWYEVRKARRDIFEREILRTINLD